MEKAGVDLLIVTDPSNMAWLTGYDGWSFYVHQCVLVLPDEDPIWYGRGQDANGAKRTVYMAHDRLIGYPDNYVQSTERPPMDFLSALTDERGWGSLRTGCAMHNSSSAARCLTSHPANLPTAQFPQAPALLKHRKTH